jgi:hypothetical protein
MIDPKALEIYGRISDSIIQRFHVNADKTLLDVYQVDSDFIALDTDFLEFAIVNRDEIAQVLSDPQARADLIDLFVKTSVEFTYESNQFIHLDSAEETILRNIYASYLDRIREIIEKSNSLDALEIDLLALMRVHFQDLKHNIARFFDDQAAQQVRENVILKKAICSQYSPELQLDLLGISIHQLAEPVLDLGCGKSGYLTRYLVSEGVNAFGLDRLIDPFDCLMAGDWFEFDWQPGVWGTIISHMAFSNHFLFHHRYQNGQPEKYARAYMRILASLKPGGAFYYSPGLPFIEVLLPGSTFSITHKTVQPLGAMPADLWSATRIVRR